MLSSFYSVIRILIDVGLKPSTLYPFDSALKGGVIYCVSCNIQPLIRIINKSILLINSSCYL